MTDFLTSHTSVLGAFPYHRVLRQTIYNLRGSWKGKACFWQQSCSQSSKLWLKNTQGLSQPEAHSWNVTLSASRELSHRQRYLLVMTVSGRSIVESLQSRRQQEPVSAVKEEYLSQDCRSFCTPSTQGHGRFKASLGYVLSSRLARAIYSRTHSQIIKYK